MTTIASPEARARAVELSKTLGRLPEFRDVSFAPESYDEATRSIEFVCSTPVQDRHGTIVKQKWRLEWFNQNPIALFGHDSRSPIGRWELGVKGGKLRGRLFFAHGDADADKYLNLAKQGVLRAVSVGFIPHSYKWEMHDDVEVLVFDDNELLEVSLVSIPANPEALARDVPLHPTTEPASHPAQPQPAAQRDVGTAGDAVVRLATSAESRAQAQEQRAVAAERRAQEFEARAVKAEGELAASQKAANDAETARKAAEADRDAHKKRADELDGERLVRKVDGLVGVKFTPARRDFWLKQAQKDESNFDETMAQTDDLPTAVGLRVVDPKDPEPPVLDPKDQAKRLRNMAKARAKEDKVPEHVAMSRVLREHPELRALWPSIRSSTTRPAAPASPSRRRRPTARSRSGS